MVYVDRCHRHAVYYGLPEPSAELITSQLTGCTLAPCLSAAAAAAAAANAAAAAGAEVQMEPRAEFKQTMIFTNPTEVDDLVL